MKTVKLKRIQINPDALVEIMLDNTAWRVKKGIPKGAIVKGSVIDPYSNMLNIFIEHESFDPIKIGQLAPLLETEIIKIK